MITGADRIAANGDTANKIGTYGLAVLAHHHEIPFVIVAPTSTIDPAAADGAAIPIEERDGAEVTARFAARNPAFDVTPAALITAIVTEEGVHRAPYARVASRAGDAPGDPGRGRSRLPRDPRGARFDAETFERAARGARRRHVARPRQRRPGRGRATAARFRPGRTCLHPGSRVSPRRRRLARRRCSGGRIAMLVLAGGMATRFGGGVKAVAEALDGRSFLEVKLGETRAARARSSTPRSRSS